MISAFRQGSPKKNKTIENMNLNLDLLLAVD